MRKIICISICFLAITISAFAQQLSMSQRMAATAMKLWKDSTARWSYEPGVVLDGITQVWLQTADKKYFDYVHNYIDALVADDGKIKGYEKNSYTLDNILCGRSVLKLCNVLEKEKYYKAALTLRDQLKEQPRTSEGGFYHKKKYRDQMWLDGLYMAEPFYAEYANTFHEESDFGDIANQFILAENHMRDSKTGLLYHGWDQSREERWANLQTGLSQNIWARADGWYAMALID